MGSTLNVGVVGVGVISNQYFASFPRLSNLKLAAVADLDVARAASVAAAQGTRALSVDAILTDPGIDVILNLTIPAAHAEIALRALDGGKHVYGEKPLALTTADAATRARAGGRRGPAGRQRARHGARHRHPDHACGALMPGGSANRSEHPFTGRIPDTSSGIRLPGSTTSPAADRYSTWARTTWPAS